MSRSGVFVGESELSTFPLNFGMFQVYWELQVGNLIPYSRLTARSQPRKRVACCRLRFFLLKLSDSFDKFSTTWEKIWITTFFKNHPNLTCNVFALRKDLSQQIVGVNPHLWRSRLCLERNGIREHDAPWHESFLKNCTHTISRHTFSRVCYDTSRGSENSSVNYGLGLPWPWVGSGSLLDNHCLRGLLV